jgi:hypothetical protein
MPQSLKHFFKQLPPFILIGISIALAIAIFIVFSYVLLWGLVIGAMLWGITTLMQYFRGLSSTNAIKPSKGRVIDHEEK